MSSQQLSKIRRAAIILVMLALAVWALGGGGGVARGQDHEQLTVKVSGFHADGWSRAQAVVSVLDGGGTPVSGLTKSDFRTLVNNVEVPPVSLTTGVDSTVPLVAVLAIDTSSAMDPDGLARAKIGAASFLDGLRPQDSIAVLAFGDTPVLVQPFTHDHDAALAAIDGLVAVGGAALYDATQQSVLLASAQADSGRRAIVLLSGRSDSSSASSDEATFAAKALGVPVFAIGIGALGDSPFLRDVTQVSGGVLAQSPAPSDLPDQLGRVSTLLRDQYIITFDATPADVRGSSPATLRVEVSAIDGRAGSDERAVCAQRACVGLAGIAANERISKSVTVEAQVITSDTVTSVSLLVDGKSVSTVSQPPYQFALNPKDLGSGSHTLAVEVRTSSDSARSEETAVQVPKAGGGISLIAIGAAVFATCVALAVAFLALRWRRRGSRRNPFTPRPRPAPPGNGEARRSGPTLIHRSEDPTSPPLQPDVALGRLTATAGPIAGRTFTIGATPVSVGSSARSHVRFPEPDGPHDVGREYARIWIREDHLVLHELRRLTAHGVVGGGWEMLTTGDTFVVGPCTFSVEIMSAGLATAPGEPVGEHPHATTG